MNGPGVAAVTVQRAFSLGWCKVAGVLALLWGGIYLFHHSAIGVLVGIVAGATVVELVPSLDARSETQLLAAEMLGAAVAVAFAVAYWRLSWWVLAGAVVLAAALRAGQVRSARSRAGI